MGFEPTTSSMPSRRAPSCATAPPKELHKVYHKICAAEASAEMGEEGAGAAVQGAAAKDCCGDGALGLRVGDADKAAGLGFVHGHFGDEGDAHAGADHGKKAGEVAAFEDDARVEARAIAGSDGGVAEAVPVAKKEK